jgi:DNA-binding transcriptional regulator YiaG
MKAERFRALRESLMLTQAQAAGLFDVHPRTWRKWESGGVAIPRSTAVLLLLVADDPKSLGTLVATDVLEAA